MAYLVMLLKSGEYVVRLDSVLINLGDFLIILLRAFSDIQQSYTV